MDFSDRFIYRRDNEIGEYCFDGTPCPTKEVYESIGEAGIAHIQKMLKEMIEIRKKMFGSGSAKFFGFRRDQAIFDMENRTLIHLVDNAKRCMEESKPGFFNLQFPELVTEESFLMSLIENPWGGLGKTAFKNRVDSWQNENFRTDLPKK